MLKLIKDDGWVQVRQTGSHRQFQHPTKSGGVTVSGHPSRDLPPGIVNSIMKQAGLRRRKE
jgi:predicted RNA binding protein YcfA (HicA-like mRNA interferase family)